MTEHDFKFSLQFYVLRYPSCIFLKINLYPKTNLGWLVLVHLYLIEPLFRYLFVIAFPCRSPSPLQPNMQKYPGMTPSYLELRSETCRPLPPQKTFLRQRPGQLQGWHWPRGRPPRDQGAAGRESQLGVWYHQAGEAYWEEVRYLYKIIWEFHLWPSMDGPHITQQYCTATNNYI